MTAARSHRPARSCSGRVLRRGLAVLVLVATVVGLGGLGGSGWTLVADAAAVAPRTLPTVSSARLTSATFSAPAPQDYPYASSDAVPGLDPHGFVRGECTSFVAWWLTSHGVPFGVLTRGPDGVGTFLNASGWDSSARAAGFEVGTRPVVGAIAQWRSGERSFRHEPTGDGAILAAGPPGHVAVVTGVFPDGQAQWVEFGWSGSHELHVGYGNAPRYLYIGVAAPD